MNRVPPELINYENQMDDFMAQSKRKNTLVLIKSFPKQSTSEELRKQWMDAYTANIAQKKTKPSRGILIGMAWCALFWIALGLIVWMVR